MSFSASATFLNARTDFSGRADALHGERGAATHAPPAPHARHGAQTIGPPTHAPALVHVSPLVHGSESSQGVPVRGVHADGSPLHVQHGSTPQVALQPSPSSRFPSSHVSVRSIVPVPQRVAFSVSGYVPQWSGVAGSGKSTVPVAA